MSIGLGLINKYLVSGLTSIAEKIVSIGLALIVYERASVHVDTDSGQDRVHWFGVDRI